MNGIAYYRVIEYYCVIEGAHLHSPVHGKAVYTDSASNWTHHRIPGRYEEQINN